MGRKGAPQTLSLPEESGSGTMARYTPVDALTSTEPTSMEHDGLTPPSDSFHVASTPTSSKSPKSPRSPFSRLNASRKPQIQVHAHSPSDPPAELSSQAIGVHRPLYSVDDVHTHQYQHSHEALENRPKTSAGQQRSTSKQSTQQTRTQPEHSRSGSRFWGFGKSSKSSNQLHQTHKAGSSEVMSRGVDYPGAPDNPPSKTIKHSETDLSLADASSHKGAALLPSRSDASLTSTGDYDSSTSRKNKPKPFGLRGRNKSFKGQNAHSAKETSAMKTSELDQSSVFSGQQSQSLRASPAPPEGHDKSFRHMVNSAVRNHSADRALSRDIPGNKEGRSDKDHNRSHPSSYREPIGSIIFNGLKYSGSRAFDMGKQFFGKSSRSEGSSIGGGEPAVDDEHYVLKVINLPLVEQTRLTRISKRLEDSRDKTEFWMPAFPWRAIDYLNYKGTEVEGLYRVPGSGPQIKKWQRKFDEEGDVDLFAQDDLYDINIVGSMLKAWLRELPDELFPKAAQERVARECSGTEEVPPLLVEELSNLSPFNYYLLFAITCHLSLLLAHSDKNKMDFRNLCICFQPCMKIDAFCFKFLVCNWRNCWQGCKNEARYIEEEYMLLNQPVPRVVYSGPRLRNDASEDRNISSSDSSKQSTLAQEQHQNGKTRMKPLASGPSNGSMASDSTEATSLVVESGSETRRKYSSELRPLSPIKPLSPLEF
ncbi:hypothetical protein DL762_003518 [Monosporascus cannonballus]|uniref:Rho-GAP domain-containing protein n=1 Tax=Monosporascus cannonballus TaxID=155416 RepID=A0ABY0HAG5_9PEZI|nr:hypothetical protein DL762_003518 [Monosporascus cannonballus]